MENTQVYETFDYLTEVEKTKIEHFLQDRDMYNAVKKVLLAALYQHGTIQLGGIPNPLINGAFSLVSLAMTNPIPDEKLGEHIRGMWAGINHLENALKYLETIHPHVEEEEEEAVNPAQ